MTHRLSCFQNPYKHLRFAPEVERFTVAGLRGQSFPSIEEAQQARDNQNHQPIGDRTHEQQH